MNSHLRTILAILGKDLHGLLPLVLLTLVVFAVQPVIANLDLESVSEFWIAVQMNFYWLGYAIATFLMLSVIQLDPANSLEHDWLTRPIARRDWLLAKLLFLTLTIWLPIVITRLIANLGNDYGFSISLAYAVTIENPAGLLPVPLFFMVALLTSTLRKALFVFFLVFMIFIAPAWDVTRPVFHILGIDLGTDYSGMMWLQSVPMAAIGIVACGLVYWLLYCRRMLQAANIAFSIAVLLLFFTAYTPVSIYGWEQAIALHRAMINQPHEAALEADVQLEHATACFPAAPVDGGAVTEAGNAVLVQAGLYPEIVDRAGNGAVVFAAAVRARNPLFEWVTPSTISRGVAVDWRIDRIRVQAHLVTDSNPDGVALIRSNQSLNRFAPNASVATDYWLIPGSALESLVSDPTTQLVLDYDLALLQPTSYELPTDGHRHQFPQLGSCRATVDDRANTIDVECVKPGSQPALVSAALVGLPSSRVDNLYRASYRADWIEAISRERYELTLQNPDLVDSSVILLTAFEAERILHRQLVSPGLFGGPASICPSPMDEQFAAIEQSSWSDDSPHQVSSVAVERGVRVEVLDWRSDNDGDRPLLFLLPGLGATGHSYDELAPKLAEKYDVVAMTRRGTGDSGKPDHGYHIQRLAEDVIQVLDTLNIESPILVGHSIAGEELSYLGAHHPDRIAGLVYLDAAYDRTRNSPEQRAQNARLPTKPAPRPAEFVSYEAAAQYQLRTGGTTRNIPEGEIMASYDFNTGAIRHDSLYLDAISMGLQAPEYDSIPLPALGIFAVSSSADSEMEAWYDPTDPEIRDVVARQFETGKRFQEEQIARFSNGIKNSQVLVLEDADHWIFVSNEQDVLNAIDNFVAGLNSGN